MIIAEEVVAKQQNLSKYGKHFQEKLVQIIIEDRKFADQIGEVLRTEFLELKYLQVFIDRIYNHKKKYNSYPSKSGLASILNAELKKFEEPLKLQIVEFFSKVKEKLKIEDEEYIKDTALDFCKRQKFKEAIQESISLIDSSSYGEIKNLFENALKLGENNDFGHDYLLDFNQRFEDDDRKTLTTGWGKIDNICNGGFASGELIVFIAASGNGKSMLLTHLGGEALRQGLNVFHYTLELRDKKIGSRYDTLLSGISLNKLKACKEDVFNKVKDVPGRLIIKEYPTKTATTMTIRNHLDKAISADIKPGFIIVDYADLLRPISNPDAKRFGLEEIYEDLRAIAMEYDVPVVTASQTNRTGINAEVITMESISEAYNKCFVADFIMSLSRTPDDKMTKGGRFFIAKNRNGPDGQIFPLKIDYEFVSIQVQDQVVKESLDQVIDEINKKNEKVIEKVQKDTYKKYLKMKKEDEKQGGPDKTEEDNE